LSKVKNLRNFRLEGNFVCVEISICVSMLLSMCAQTQKTEKICLMPIIFC
jgi:hypothetical protein